MDLRASIREFIVGNFLFGDGSRLGGDAVIIRTAG